MSYLLGLSSIHNGLKTMNYQFQPCTEFTMNERGKVRHITGEQIQDRVSKHALCDEVLSPGVKKYLIYDNGASQEGKGLTLHGGGCWYIFAGTINATEVTMATSCLWTSPNTMTTYGMMT